MSYVDLEKTYFNDRNIVKIRDILKNICDSFNFKYCKLFLNHKIFFAQNTYVQQM